MSSDTNNLEPTPSSVLLRRTSLLAIFAAASALGAMVLVGHSRQEPSASSIPVTTAPTTSIASSESAIESMPSISGLVAERISVATPETLDLAATAPLAVPDRGVPGRESSKETAFLSGVVFDSAGRPVSNARVTALRPVDGRCPAAFYGEQSFSELAPQDGLRARSDEAGGFAIFGAEPGVEYDVFVDLQGEDLWWIDSCAITIEKIVAPAQGLRLELPYGVVIAKLEFPHDLQLLRAADASLDVRLRVSRGPDDESVVGDVGDRLRIAVDFERPISITAEGTGVRSITIDDVAVSRVAGTIEVPITLESTGLAHRLTVLVTDVDGAPIQDTWVYEVGAFDPPRFESLRTAGCSSRDDGVFVFELLEAGTHTIVAIPDTDSDFAPAGSIVELPPSGVRELQLDLARGEFVEVRIPQHAGEVTMTSLECPDLDFELGRLVEWVEVGRSSWERWRTFAPGMSYRTTFRLPFGRYEIHYVSDGVEAMTEFTVEVGNRTRIELGATR